MNIDRIKEIQKETSYPESVSVQQALLKVWNECNQEQEQENISSWSALTNLDYLRSNNGSLTGDISSWPEFVIDAVQRVISESIIEYISQHPTEQPTNELSDEDIYKCMLRGGKDNCSYKSKDAIACIMLRKCEYVKLIESTEQPTKKDYLQRYKDMTNSREFEEAYLNKPSCEQPSNTRELSAEEIIKISEKYANEYGGSMFGLAYKSFRAGIEYIIKNRK